MSKRKRKSKEWTVVVESGDPDQEYNSVIPPPPPEFVAVIAGIVRRIMNQQAIAKGQSDREKEQEK